MSSCRAFKDAATAALTRTPSHRLGHRLGLASPPLTIVPTLAPFSAARSFHSFRTASVTAPTVPHTSKLFLPQQQHQSRRRALQLVSRRAYSSYDDLTLSTPLAKTVIATTRVVRNVLLFSTSTLALGFFVWSGTHAYLEQYKCPSPPGLSKQVQNCLHGAWVREEVSPDPDIAEVYLQKAAELARKDLEAFYKNKYKGSNDKNNDAETDARVFLEIEKDRALAEIQNRLATFYARNGQDEQAATIWTRLQKLTERDIPSTTSSSASGASQPSSGLSLGSLFGGSSKERPLLTQQDGVPFARRAADCWMRMGEYDHAEEALSWTLSTVTAATSSTTGSATSSDNVFSPIDEVGVLSTLGALYVRQQKFDYALSLFVKALQLVQEHRAALDAGQNEDTSIISIQKEKDMWYCREAILTHSIGETLYGAAARFNKKSNTGSSSGGKKDESLRQQKKSSWKFWSSSSSAGTATATALAGDLDQHKKEEAALGWMQKAITMAKEKTGLNRDCDECAALGLNNIGLIYEMEGKTDIALEQFKEAVLYATRANDYMGLDDYVKNMARVADKVAAVAEPAVPLSSPSSSSVFSAPSSPLPSPPPTSA
ncbi:hypothetical protein BGZ99_001419 [Dissophora globulifera]|uniref:Uncharacterized protein n=1 Tax=Dissophora globulifera TaxID=979702 RepID=A0A9P6UY24_9FUNG|nr:hypothetical protein BGZ99_001419 [Dissophora globulifera]